MVLNWGWFLSPQDFRQCLETFWLLWPRGGAWRYYWRLVCRKNYWPQMLIVPRLRDPGLLAICVPSVDCLLIIFLLGTLYTLELSILCLFVYITNIFPSWYLHLILFLMSFALENLNFYVDKSTCFFPLKGHLNFFTILGFLNPSVYKHTPIFYSSIFSFIHVNV